MTSNYIMAGFIREMDSYPIEYRLIKKDGKYLLEYKNLPTKLDFMLLRAKYEQNLVIGETKTMFGNYKKVDHSLQKVCNPISDGDNKILQIDLTDEYCNSKLNVISHLIREYFSIYA